MGIEEWHAQEQRSTWWAIAYSHLKDNNWWRETELLILTPDPVIEDIAIRQLKKKTHWLA